MIRVVTHNDVRSRASLKFDRGADVLNQITAGCRASIAGNLLGMALKPEPGRRESGELNDGGVRAQRGRIKAGRQVEAESRRWLSETSGTEGYERSSIEDAFEKVEGAGNNSVPNFSDDNGTKPEVGEAGAARKREGPQTAGGLSRVSAHGSSRRR